jgi:uncharacterized protein YbjT (DUF2867 family)
MILVTGATGNVGSELVTALLAAGSPVRALSRNSTTTGVDLVPGNLDDPDSLGPALSDVDAVFLLPGFKDMPGVLTAFHPPLGPELRISDVVREPFPKSASPPSTRTTSPPSPSPPS